MKISLWQTLLCYFTLNSEKMISNATSSVSQPFTLTNSEATIFVPNATNSTSNVSTQVSIPPIKTTLGTKNSYTTAINSNLHMSTVMSTTNFRPPEFISTVKGNALTKKHAFRINNEGTFIDRLSIIFGFSEEY